VVDSPVDRPSTAKQRVTAPSVPSAKPPAARPPTTMPGDSPRGTGPGHAARASPMAIPFRGVTGDDLRVPFATHAGRHQDPVPG
jgi:hypothetical protein